MFLTTGNRKGNSHVVGEAELDRRGRSRTGGWKRRVQQGMHPPGCAGGATHHPPEGPAAHPPQELRPGVLRQAQERVGARMPQGGPPGNQVVTTCSTQRLRRPGGVDVFISKTLI